MTLTDISSSIGANLLASLGQTQRTRSSAATGNDAVSRAFDQANERIKQQQSSTQVSLSAFGQLRSSVDQLQKSSAALTDNKNTDTPAEASAAAQSFVSAFNNAQTTARSVTNSASGVLADNGRATIAASQVNRTLNDNSREQLRQIGINRNQDGTLSINQQRFQQALQSNPQQVGSALANVGQQVQDTAARQLGNSSQLSRGVATLNTQAQALSAQQVQQQQAAQQATQPEQAQQDQAAQQQQNQQQAQQQATDAGNSFNAIAASGIAAYQRIFGF